MSPTDLIVLYIDSFLRWRKDNAPRMGAALAYYTDFSMAPVRVISVALTGLVFGRQAAEGRIVEQIRGVVGQDAATFIQAMVMSARKPSSGVFTTVIGALTLLLGSLAVFGQLMDPLNIIWGARFGYRRGALAMVRDQAMSFLVVLGIGLLLTVSLALSAMLGVLAKLVGQETIGRV